MNLAEWVSRSHGPASSRGSGGSGSSGMAAATWASLAVDFSLEKLLGFDDLLQQCIGLVRLEATGNELTSLAGTI